MENERSISGGILSGIAIREAVERGAIQIDPFEPVNVNPASVDLRLGSEVIVMGKPYVSPPPFGTGEAVIDVVTELRAEDWYHPVRIEDDGLVLYPDMLYLMHTLERVCTLDYVPVLDGKSSLGRIGVSVHETAGYGDPGFNGQYTLEVAVRFPTKLYAGMRICQMRFHSLLGDRVNYAERGNYVGGLATGPVCSQIHKQFRKGAQ